MANKDLNRLKVVLVEQHKTAKWLAEQERANCKPFARKIRYLLPTALQVRTCC